MAFFTRRKDRGARGSGVPQNFRAALTTVLEGLDRVDTEAVARYVLTGSDTAVLASVSGHWWSTSLIGRYRARSRASDRADRRMLAGIADVDVEVMHRWVTLLETAGLGGAGMGAVHGLRWPEMILRHADHAIPAPETLPFTLADLARLLDLSGATPADLLEAALEVVSGADYYDQGGRPALVRLPGFDALLLEHAATVVAAASAGPADRRVQTLGLLDALDASGLASFTDVIVLGAAANAKEVRRRAGELLERIDPAAVDASLRALATSGKPDERGRALQLLHDRSRDDADRRWLEETALADRAGSVRGLVDGWRAAVAAPEPGPIELPALPPVDWAVPAADADRVGAAVSEQLARQFADHNLRQVQWANQRSAAVGKVVKPRLVTPPDKLAGRLSAALTASRPVAAAVVEDRIGRHFLGRTLLQAAAGESAVTVVQLLRACGLLPDGAHVPRDWVLMIEESHRLSGGPGLDRWQQLLDGVGIDGYREIWSSYNNAWPPALGRHWPDDDVWPFVARNLDAVLRDGPSMATSYIHDPAAFFAALATLPTPPTRVLDQLYAIALGTQKSLRSAAQDALARDPALVTRVAAALGDGRGEIRAVAAQWLTRIADPAVLPELQAAWAKEKQDLVRGYLLDALEALGEPVADYLDLEATTTRARKLVDRGLPAALSWLDWDQVPEVRWAGSDDLVPLVIVQWLVATAVKARTSEPNALLRRYAELIEPADRERLGAHLLAVWLAEDTRPIPIADAQQQAQQHAGYQLQWAASDPQSPYHGKSLAEVAAMLLPGFARQPVGSATPSKGLLAVVAATAGRDVVAPVERYLKEWYGQRASQGKALIAMLAWVEHPAATQLMLSVGSRFRTKSFQQEATRQAEALAERRGWTLEELADRTIPTAGFDRDGVLELSYGPRVFTARLRPDLTVVLSDPDGKVVTSLPTPRHSDDADLAKDAKKALTAAKKDVKGIARLQAERLYEALCTERDWPADDWRRYLADHPVVGPACRRLVWVGLDPDDETFRVSFRPLDDGSLTDVEDGEVRLEARHRVRLAHDTVLPADEVRQWVEHLADYEIDPLFQQLGKGSYQLPEARRAAEEIADYEGHLLDAFTLRGRALKSGYTRGPSEDAGWFSSYRKRFPTLGLVAQLGFTGNVLPEENRTVALTRLSFLRELPQDRGEEVLALGAVPAVLLSEMVGDLQLFAADGTGFDPEWQQKSAY